MITLDQVQLLEKKVETIVSKINDLQKQNSALQRQNSALQEKNRELIEKNSLLMQKISTFEADQNRIEEGILNALDRLNSMENSVLNVGTSVTNEQANTQQTVVSDDKIQKEETTHENTNSQFTQDSSLTDFSNISETEQNFTGTDENASVQDSPNLNFTDEDINESENSNGIKEESLDFGLDLDFDSNVENTDDSQLGIF